MLSKLDVYIVFVCLYHPIQPISSWPQWFSLQWRLLHSWMRQSSPRRCWTLHHNGPINLFDDSQSDYFSSISNFQEQKARIETNLPPTRSYKPRKEPCPRPSKSTPYISRENLSPEHMKHLERNRIAANKCRMKKRQEHKEIQSTLDTATIKRKALLAEISVLKEDVWQLKNRMLQHAAKCDDQDIYQGLARMTQNMNHATSHCPSPSFSVSTMSDGPMESEGRWSKSNSFAKSTSIPSSESPENLFDSYIDLSTLWMNIQCTIIDSLEFSGDRSSEWEIDKLRSLWCHLTKSTVPRWWSFQRLVFVAKLPGCIWKWQDEELMYWLVLNMSNRIRWLIEGLEIGWAISGAYIVRALARYDTISEFSPNTIKYQGKLGKRWTNLSQKVIAVIGRFLSSSER